MAVRIVQLLCPERHCIVAGAYEEGNGNSDATIESLKEMLGALSIDDRCGLCGSTDLQFEDALTKYATMREAAPKLAETARRNQRTRALIEQLRSSTN